MQEMRRARLSSVIQEELSRVISREIKDPRIPTLTITQVDVTQDGKQATCFINILGGSTPEAMKECLAGLTSSIGFLRRGISKALSVRHIPQLIFKEDKGLDNALKVHQLLKQLSDSSAASPSDKKTE